MKFDTEKAKKIIAERGDCTGPVCQLPSSNGYSKETVTILCNNYVPVVEWIALCEHQFPVAIKRVEKLEDALEEALKWIADRSDEGSILLSRLYGVLNG